MAGRQREILARIGRLAVAGELPDGQEALADLLVAQGFARDEVLLVLSSGDVGQPGVALSEAEPTRLAQLSANATRFINVLRAVGYLDDLSEEQVLDLAMDENSGDIGLDEIRRHVAAVMFDRQFEMDPETLRLLEEEWRLVFH